MVESLFTLLKRDSNKVVFLSFAVKIPSNYIKYMFNIFQIASFFLEDVGWEGEGEGVSRKS